jgi:hypothetical protein
MPQTILSSALSSPSLAVTSDQTAINVSQACGVSKVVIRLRSRIFRHKREDGTTIVDARVNEPKQVEISVFTPTLDALAMLNSALLDRGSTYTVKSRGLVFTSMMMDEANVKQTAEMISASPVVFTMKELLTQDGSTATQTVAQPADSTLLDRGIQQMNTAVATVQSLAAQIQATVGSTVSEVAGTLGI